MCRLIVLKHPKTGELIDLTAPPCEPIQPPEVRKEFERLNWEYKEGDSEIIDNWYKELQKDLYDYLERVQEFYSHFTPIW